jgi:hypothetical protein
LFFARCLFPATFHAFIDKEEHVMKTTTVAWAMGAVLAIAPAVSAQTSAARGATPVTLRVHVDDYAGVTPKMLTEAEHVAAQIYRAVGIEMLWGDDPLEPFNDPLAGRGRPLTVILLSPKQTEKICLNRLASSAMGVAFHNSDDDAVVAYVFYDRVERKAWKAHCFLSRLLGEVMAHEVGHMLLPHGHSAIGIMRAERTSQLGALEEFTKEQGELMRRRLAERR